MVTSIYTLMGLQMVRRDNKVEALFTTRVCC